MANNQYKNPNYKKEYNLNYYAIHGERIKKEKRIGLKLTQKHISYCVRNIRKLIMKRIKKY